MAKHFNGAGHTLVEGTLSELDFEIVRRLYLLEDTKASEVPLTHCGNT